jgi:hypothetical protein|tara:strand:+ start:803 stop:1006 length:204 start_codon:yes stop_codon:yes gene_type:complete
MKKYLKKNPRIIKARIIPKFNTHSPVTILAIIHRINKFIIIIDRNHLNTPVDATLSAMQMYPLLIIF